jgi:hypothetical protein
VSSRGDRTEATTKKRGKAPTFIAVAQLRQNAVKVLVVNLAHCHASRPPQKNRKQQTGEGAPTRQFCWLQMGSRVTSLRQWLSFPAFLLLLFTALASSASINTTLPDVLCDSKEVCVRTPGAKCTVRVGFVKPEHMKEDLRCAAPMKCLRDWAKEDEGVCVLASAGMPCLMNNFLGDCSTLQLGPNAYCAEGRCHHPPSFPGDHCWVAEECTSGSTCENNIC